MPVHIVVDEYRRAKESERELKNFTKEARDIIHDYVLTHGTPDDKGNLHYRFGDRSQIKLEKRAPRTLDPDAAERILKEAGLWEQCTEEEIVVNLLDDEIWAQLYEGNLTEEQINEIFPISEASYAVYIFE